MFLFECAIRHPDSQDFDPPGLSGSTGVDISRLQHCVCPPLFPPPQKAYWEVTILQATSPSCDKYCSFLPFEARRCQDIALLLAPEGLPLPGSLNQTVQETKSVIARTECAVCQLMIAFFERGLL